MSAPWSPTGETQPSTTSSTRFGIELDVAAEHLVHQADDEVDGLGGVQRAVALALPARCADGVEDERLTGCHGRAPFADSAGLGCPGRLHNNTTAPKAAESRSAFYPFRRARVPARDQRESGAHGRRRGRADRRDRARHRRPLAAGPARLRLLGARAGRPALQPAGAARDEGRRAAARPAARRRRARRSASRRAWARRSRRSAWSRSRSAGRTVTTVLLAALVVAATLEAALGLCVGCQIFAALMRAGCPGDGLRGVRGHLRTPAARLIRGRPAGMERPDSGGRSTVYGTRGRGRLRAPAGRAGRDPDARRRRHRGRRLRGDGRRDGGRCRR